MTEENKQTRTADQIITSMVDVFDLINSQMETIKSLKAEAKEAGYDAAILAKVAKAVSDDKVQELKDKTETLLTYLED